MNANDEYSPKLNKVELEFLDFYVREAIDVEKIALYKTGTRVFYEERFYAMVLEMKACVLHEPQDEYVISWPENWWEHFKDRWFPKWAKKKWPIKREAHRIKISLLYPKFKISLPDEYKNPRVDIQKCWDSSLDPLGSSK